MSLSDTLFGLFNKKPPNKSKDSIAGKIQSILDQGEKGLQINLYVDDQILFQVGLATHYGKRGLKGEDLDGFMELHFFNNNKTFTTENEQFAKELSKKGELIYFEEPKGVHMYIRAIGKEPVEIENVINDRIKTMYANIAASRISIEYVGY